MNNSAIDKSGYSTQTMFFTRMFFLFKEWRSGHVCKWGVFRSLISHAVYMAITQQ